MKEGLKEVRLILGYSQQEMADKLGYPVRTYRSYEYETKGYPTEFMEKLINILNVNANWLYTGKGDIFIQSFSSTLRAQPLKITGLWERLCEFQARQNPSVSDKKFANKIGMTEEKWCALVNDEDSDNEPTPQEVLAIIENLDESLDWIFRGYSSIEKIKESKLKEELGLTDKQFNKVREYFEKQN